MIDQGTTRSARHTLRTIVTRERDSHAITFDLDPVSLTCLREVLPSWKFDVRIGVTLDSLIRSWRPDSESLICLGFSDDTARTFALCRFLAFCRAYSNQFRNDGDRDARVTPIVVIVPPEQQFIEEAAFRAGADHCLTLPINSITVTSVFPHQEQDDHSRGRLHSSSRTRREGLRGRFSGKELL